MASTSTSRVGIIGRRTFSTSSSRPAPRIRRWQWNKLDSKLQDSFVEYKFDDATSLGWLRLFKIREAQELFRKMEVDREALRAQSRPFIPPPKGAIRLTTTIDLSEPDSSRHMRQVLMVPVDGLPLKGSEATHRLKLIAGPRWTPHRPGNEIPSEGNDEVEGKEGWIKISEDRFESINMNRKSTLDMLEKLVDAANDPNSPLSTSIPLDTRHVLAKQNKENVSRRAKMEVVGGVRGFPREWLPQVQST
ncbi:hypothetical protein TREMEDRAFT_29420 [Tremella mesenterica DSM 1558]|uniref:uncharacterized protein n=1 Tax=Tremella mesenterica (strain ATCC 24925 / CBS 8224 / DSM 1558 / NBRC 9311 / NRRL Y-6157 / RJB 2259-6 / UBC 559-6) TaxID=578456 RepID=UPI0003F4A544|nr:uncharacterized protein TREMEDRAFT_29420 [Tremella mesenterica DSM 1558]EIW70084.1 hypothetical protein TREMEDRAFT_29420 [Tremella mesenterica DSM 1558]